MNGICPTQERNSISCCSNPDDTEHGQVIGIIESTRAKHACLQDLAAEGRDTLVAEYVVNAASP